MYNGNYSDQKQYLLDTSKLTIFADTILGYRSDIVLDMDYEVIKQDYLICDKDSLSLIFSGFYWLLIHDVFPKLKEWLFIYKYYLMLSKIGEKILIVILKLFCLLKQRKKLKSLCWNKGFLTILS